MTSERVAASTTRRPRPAFDPGIGGAPRALLRSATKEPPTMTTNDTTKTLTAGIAAITTARRLARDAFEAASFAAGALGLETDTKDERGNPAKPADIERALREAHGAAERATLNLARALGLPKAETEPMPADALRVALTCVREIARNADSFSREARQAADVTDDAIVRMLDALGTAAEKPACTVADLLGGKAGAS